ncbi:MAG: RdgB/HAM1 family non-canonical purine NTP pyrophosphatase [Lachnospiraceae bacterium]|jgi:XTP/dITP diphosphohydrolase|nr:RdgB/HAM1 family non-canonical purine NTP pyrophosphatase [Lachnospiraceae bacterium]
MRDTKELFEKTMIFATENAGKMHEIRQIMLGCGWTILSAKEAGITMDVEETGMSFAENALQKARFAAKQIQTNKAFFEKRQNVLIVADDSGLEIDALNKEPGIYSARYMGEKTSYEIKNANLLERMKDVATSQRTARFVCAIAAVMVNGEEQVFVETIEGMIANEPRGENGFGYDPIFWLQEYAMTSAQLSEEHKNEISHRAKALRKLRESLRIEEKV